MIDKTKTELLAHYAERDPVRFVQIDGYLNSLEFESGIPDTDGDGLTSGATHELMSGGYNVRALIRPDTPPAEAARLLRKAAAWIEQGALDNCFDEDNPLTRIIHVRDPYKELAFSEEEVDDFWATKALEEKWDAAKLAAHGLTKEDVERARRLKASGFAALREQPADDGWGDGWPITDAEINGDRPNRHHDDDEVL